MSTKLINEEHLDDLLAPPEPLISRAVASGWRYVSKRKAPIRPTKPPSATGLFQDADSSSKSTKLLYYTLVRGGPREARQHYLSSVYYPYKGAPVLYARLRMSEAGAELAPAAEAAAYSLESDKRLSVESDTANDSGEHAYVSDEDLIAAEAILAPSLPVLGYGASPSEAVISMGAASYEASMARMGAAPAGSTVNSSRVSPGEMPDVSMRRSFRVGWTAHGRFAHSGAPASGIRVYNHGTQYLGVSMPRTPGAAPATTPRGGKVAGRGGTAMHCTAAPCASTSDKFLASAHAVHVECVVPAGGLLRGAAGTWLPTAGPRAYRQSLEELRQRFTRPILLAWGRDGSAGDGGHAMLGSAAAALGKYALELAGAAAEDRRVARLRRIQVYGSDNDNDVKREDGSPYKGMVVCHRVGADPMAAPSSWFLAGSARHAAELLRLLQALVGLAPAEAGSADSAPAAAWRAEQVLTWLRRVASRQCAQGTHVRDFPGNKGGVVQGVIDSLRMERLESPLHSRLRRAALAGDWAACCAAAEVAGVPWLGVAVMAAASGGAGASRRVASWIRSQSTLGGDGSDGSAYGVPGPGPAAWAELCGVGQGADARGGAAGAGAAYQDYPVLALVQEGGAGRAALALASGALETPEASLQARSWAVGFMATAGAWLSAGGRRRRATEDGTGGEGVEWGEGSDDWGGGGGTSEGKVGGGGYGGVSASSGGDVESGFDADAVPLGNLAVDAMVRAFTCVVREGAAAHPQPWWLERVRGPLTAPELEAIDMDMDGDGGAYDEDGEELGGGSDAVTLSNPADALARARDLHESGEGGSVVRAGGRPATALDWSLNAPTDACWALLRLAATSRNPSDGPQAGMAQAPLGHVLRPSGSTPDPADCRLPFVVLWSLMASGHAVGYADGRRSLFSGAEPMHMRSVGGAAGSTNESIAVHSLLLPAARRAACSTVLGFAAYLEAEGYWPWSVAVLMRSGLAMPRGPGVPADGTIPRAVLAPTTDVAAADSSRNSSGQDYNDVEYRFADVAADATESLSLWLKDARVVLDRCVPDRLQEPKLFDSLRGILQQPVVRGTQQDPLAAAVPTSWMPLAAARRLVATRAGLWHCLRSSGGGFSAMVTRCLLTCVAEAQAVLRQPALAATGERLGIESPVLAASSLQAAEEAAALSGRLLDRCILPQALLREVAGAEAHWGTAKQYIAYGRGRTNAVTASRNSRPSRSRSQATHQSPLLFGTLLETASNFSSDSDSMDGQWRSPTSVESVQVPPDEVLDDWTPGKLLAGIQLLLPSAPLLPLPAWHPDSGAPSHPQAAPWRIQVSAVAVSPAVRGPAESPLVGSGPVTPSRTRYQLASTQPAVGMAEALCGCSGVEHRASGIASIGRAYQDAPSSTTGASWITTPMPCEGSMDEVRLPAIATARVLALCRLLQRLTWYNEKDSTRTSTRGDALARLLRMYALRVLGSLQEVPRSLGAAWVAACEYALRAVRVECTEVMRHRQYQLTDHALAGPGVQGAGRGGEKSSGRGSSDGFGSIAVGARGGEPDPLRGAGALHAGAGAGAHVLGSIRTSTRVSDAMAALLAGAASGLGARSTTA